MLATVRYAAWLVVLGGVVCLLPACATYRPEPLPDAAGLLNDVTMARAGDGTSVPVDFSDGLDIDEVAVIAVLNNPGLRAARAAAGVADAQLFAAGLFPDPQVTLGVDEPTTEMEDLVRALALGIGVDVAALVTHGPAKDAAAAAAQQVRLDVVWQEWQVAQQARIDAARYRAESSKLQFLEASRVSFDAQANAAGAALDRGDLTVDVAATYLTAAIDAGNALYRVQLQHSDTAHELNALLGLEPTVVLDLVSGPAATEWPPVDMATVAAQRPDLLALQAGYRSQEARLRQAVWAQFPAISLTWNRVRDTSSIWSTGLSTTLNMPIFSGGRGAIAIEKATRQMLRNEYAERLAQSAADIARLRSDGAIQQNQQRYLQGQLPTLTTMVEQAERGAHTGDLGAVVSISLRASLVAKQLELIDVEQTLWETRIALDTLLGSVSR